MSDYLNFLNSIDIDSLECRGCGNCDPSEFDIVYEPNRRSVCNVCSTVFREYDVIDENENETEWRSDGYNSGYESEDLLDFEEDDVDTEVPEFEDVCDEDDDDDATVVPELDDDDIEFIV